MISIKDFQKLDIKIGTILSAEKVPDTDKLLKLSVDLGEEESREVVAGIAEHFSEPESLIGKQIPVLANLKPRVLRGNTSNGMILAVSGEGSFSLLSPDEKVSNGSSVK
jgi:methionyl-tRNA synthetase